MDVKYRKKNSVNEKTGEILFYSALLPTFASQNTGYQIKEV